MDTLKTNVRRTVRLDAGGVVVKRFHAPGRLQRLRDRRRAERELASHERLAALGLPVPEPVEVRRTDGADGPCWELVTRWIEGAVPLRSMLDGRAPWPVSEQRVLAELGRALALAHARGLDHPDLHAGNVLVDARGRVFFVDLAGARVRRRMRAAVAVRDLVRLASDLRETTSERARSSGLSTWRRATSAELRASVGVDGSFARELERRARERRHDILHRQRRRWTRESGACRSLGDVGQAAYIARGLDPAPWVALVKAQPGVAQQRDLAPHPDEPGLAVATIEGSWGEVREVWYAAARLAGHGLRAPLPRLLIRDARSVATFALPADAVPVRERIAEDPASRTAAARALGTLFGGLHDRLLAVPSARAASRFGEPWLSAGSGTGLVAGLGLVNHLERGRALDGRPEAPLGALFPNLVETERTAFSNAWIDAQRAGRHERDTLRTELAHG